MCSLCGFFGNRGSPGGLCHALAAYPRSLLPIPFLEPPSQKKPHKLHKLLIERRFCFVNQALTEKKFCAVSLFSPHKTAQSRTETRTKPHKAPCAARVAFKCAAESRMPCQTQPRRGTHAATPALSQNWYQSVGSKKEGGPKPPMNQCW